MHCGGSAFGCILLMIMLQVGYLPTVYPTKKPKERSISRNLPLDSSKLKIRGERCPRLKQHYRNVQQRIVDFDLDPQCKNIRRPLSPKNPQRPPSSGGLSQAFLHASYYNGCTNSHSILIRPCAGSPIFLNAAGEKSMHPVSQPGHKSTTLAVT